ncbi:MAG: helix-turn-helix transcriptional regulator [Candidatus Fimenecus sp.]
MNSLGNKIKRLREERGMYQKELAEKIGITDAAICKIEKGIMLPSLPNALAIAETFNITVEELYK